MNIATYKNLYLLTYDVLIKIKYVYLVLDQLLIMHQPSSVTRSFGIRIQKRILASTPSTPTG